MQTWSITFHGAAGVISSVDAGESEFVVGTETASDVITVRGEGVAGRHAWVWIRTEGLQVEDLGGGTLVNGYPIMERVEVEYPASVQVGEITLVIEVKAGPPAPVPPTSNSMDITVPRRPVTANKASLDVAVPERTSKNAIVQAQFTDIGSTDSAPLQGEYKLVREIARGGMGQIYFGEDAQLERQVAVKVSTVSEGSEDPRFIKEAKVLAQLAHPNIVPVHNIGVDSKGRPFYSMKLVKGRTLQAILNQLRDGDASTVGDYPLPTLLTIFRKICDAMMFAHSRGILHRDLKPENIMVGEFGEVLVMDWGLAKVLGQREEDACAVNRACDTGDYGMTLEGDVMGTPQYMSPEQAVGMVAELDQRSDIYSLGGILYALLTLRPPIEGTTLDEVLTKVKTGGISSMLTKHGGRDRAAVVTSTPMAVEVPEALQAVTLKAMATDRNRRYTSVEEFAFDIERYQNGFATQAEEAGAWKRAKLWIRRHKALTASAAVLLASGILFIVRLSASERTARAHERQAIAEKETARRSLARAQIGLADAADLACDSKAISRALSDVPEDLRSPDWHYLQGRIDTANFTLASAAGKTWVAVEDLASDPDRVLALQSDGELMAVNLKTGELEARLRCQTSGYFSSCMAVSKDGKLVALAKKEGAGGGTTGSALRVYVFQIGDGKLVNKLEVSSSEKQLWEMKLTESFIVLVRSGGTRGDVAEVWDYLKNTMLWSAAGSKADLSGDAKSVYLLNSASAVEKRDVLTGRVLATGPEKAVSFHPMNRGNGVGTEDWQNFFSPKGWFSKVRCLNPWTGVVEHEMSFPNGNLGATILQNSKRFVSLGYISPEGSVLEIREFDGTVLRRFGVPINEGLMSPVEGLAVLRAKEDSIILRFPHFLKVWRLDSARPTISEVHGYGCTRLGNTKQFVHNVVLPDQTLQIVDGLEKNPQKRVLEKISTTGNGNAPFLISSASHDGNRLVYGNYGKLTAARRVNGGFEHLWGPQSVKLPDLNFSIHPTEDCIWTGEAVWEFTSGREMVRVERGDLARTSRSQSPVSVCWVGSDRVAELALSSGVADGAEPAAMNSLHMAVWSARSGKMIARDEADGATCICASPDGSFIAEGGRDKRVRIRNAHTLKVYREFRVHQDALTGIAWHPSLPFLVTASKDSTVRIWNLGNLRLLEEFTLNPGRDLWVQISPDGFELTAFGGARGVALYEPKSFRELGFSK